MTFLKQAAYSTYVLGKLSKFVQTSTRLPWIPFLFTTVSIKNKKGLELKFSFVILHKLAKFYYQTVVTSQVIQ